MGAVVDMLSRQQWTVGQLMTAVRVYCDIVLSELQALTPQGHDLDTASGGSGGRGDGARGGGVRRGQGEAFVPSVSLFDFLLMQGQFL
jgi:hypothetical protein